MALSFWASLISTCYFPFDLHHDDFSPGFRSRLLKMKCLKRFLSMRSGHAVYRHRGWSLLSFAIVPSLSWTWCRRSSADSAFVQFSSIFTLTSFIIANSSPVTPGFVSSQLKGSHSLSWVPPEGWLPPKKFELEQLKWNIELGPRELKSLSSSGPSGGFRSSSYSRSVERFVVQSSE